MNLKSLLPVIAATVFFPMVRAEAAPSAQPVKYVVALTNAGAMPFSPPIIYVRTGQSALSAVGTKATRGFIEVCQTGMTQTRVSELNSSAEVTSVQTLAGLLMPGETKTLEVEVKDVAQQSIQIETMYGKTKDVCALSSVGSHALYALKEHVTAETILKDDVVETGAFTRPSVTDGHPYPVEDACPQSKDAVTCLRDLSKPAANVSPIRFFSPYLPTVLASIEKKYGSEQTEQLGIPGAGALRVRVALKH
jgi:hypothetical protein